MRKRESKTGANFFSGLFILAAVGIIVWIGISLGREAYRKKQIQGEIDSLQSEIEKVNKQNSDLKNLVSYLNTPEFQEKEARDKLNLQKEDEKMIVLQKDAQASNAVAPAGNNAQNSPIDENLPNWKKWLQYFFRSN
jgi:cell division protein FtsB